MKGSMTSVKRYNESQPYDSSIEQFIQQSFPNTVTRTPGDTLDHVFEQVMASGKTRLGPRPSIEIQAAVREVIRASIAGDRPVPFMVPWGSEKPDGGSVDPAEMAAIKTMDCLHQRIKQFYSPGAQFAVRLEDASAPYLFNDRWAEAETEASRYVTDFTALINLLSSPQVIIPRPESMYVNAADFANAADKYYPAFQKYFIMNSTEALEELKSFGWSGAVAKETLNYYLQQYDKMYPNRDLTYKVSKLARYYASVLARKQLKLRGDFAEWNGSFLDLSFVAPAPGTEGYFNRRVLYRTLPENISSLHIPAWRAKGYFLMTESGIRPKLASYNALPEHLTHHCTTLTNESGVELELRTDYLIQ